MPQDEASEAEVEAARIAIARQEHCDHALCSDSCLCRDQARAALTAAAQVREIDWKARAAEIRTDEGDELDEVYATLGIGGNFSAIDEIKRLQAALGIRKGE